MVQWGVVGGVVCGVLLAARQRRCSARCSAATPRCTTCWCRCSWSRRSGSPIAGVVFVLDGVLIGAGDGRYLAWAGLAVLVVYTPAAFAAAYVTGGLVAVWVAFAAVFMGARFVVLTRRARGDRGW